MNPDDPRYLWPFDLEAAIQEAIDQDAYEYEINQRRLSGWLEVTK